MAKAGLEMAYWDLLGKRTGRSLAQLLGGVRRQVDVGVSIGIQRSPSALLETVACYLEKGYRRVKLKIKPGMDVEETIAVRHAYPDLRLQVDANSAYTLETAESLSPLDDLDLLLIEQPLAEDDLLDHSRLQTKFRTPLCLDESIQSPSHARQALELNSCKIINIKAARIGGLSLAVEVHDLCQLAGIPVWCGGMLETGIGRGANLALAALPNFTLPADISATERYYTQDITLEIFRLNPDSTIDVPSGPGLGISIDHRALKEVALDSLILTLLD
jgi:O-succinylbenzoate synthase